jgi:Putative auto-transporter adhesin, head GIN domain
MKNLRILTLAITILSIAACTQAQMRKTVNGDGNVIKKERKTDSFTGIKVSSGIDVYLRQGADESMFVEADENLHEYIVTEVRGGVLNVYTDANIREAERKRVYVTMKEVNSLRTSSAGDIVGETPVRTEKLEMSASSAGDIKVEVYAKEISVNISSSGDITLTGEAEKLEGDLSSAGDLNAYDLAVNQANISASSAGNADINVSEKITARASSAGDINYMGNPKYIDAHSSSAGSIRKR